MKILWIVNIIFPEPAKELGINTTVHGGWMLGAYNEIIKRDSIELAIATTYNGDKILEFAKDGIVYYLIPDTPGIKYNKRMENDWKYVKSKFCPDIVHIHGSEYSLGLAYRNAFPKDKVVMSIQGLVSVCAKVYYGNISQYDIIKNITLRDIIKNDTLFKAKKKFEIRGYNEIELIKKLDFIIGRTDWDHANAIALNKKIKYFKNDETLREDFYTGKWDISKIERNSVYCSQGQYPLKGLHYLLEAVAILKERVPNVKLYVGGNNITKSNTVKKSETIKITGYGKYIKKLIAKLGIEENVIFLGLLSASDVKKKLLSVNVFALPSLIENGSNSLGEAMLLGVPCVAANVGGIQDSLTHNVEGYLYPYSESSMLAYYIEKYFKNDDLCISHGKKSIAASSKRHNGKKNIDDLIKIYREIGDYYEK